ncbi:hypothetical protein DSCO28_47600 [Desulfosarcina ovata subsp. sediminis]|uniref:Uncharacterized protein n=1 Tax=Desulfosarcina ovata subsp. sediminis TaxID=885957 RepID=A0A5K7ZVJ7_9BACT|nr:hypothetical protein [Desulfosarcina ovata]BBO84194.1 hypothetical protein DSCO28_47600 [Desulfosarcina ovata subsp. sediminis]
MDSFLIRIYRRSPDDPEEVVGIVENINTGQRRPFNSLAGLCQAISATDPNGKDSPGTVKSKNSRKSRKGG